MGYFYCYNNFCNKSLMNQLKNTTELINAFSMRISAIFKKLKYSLTDVTDLISTYTDLIN